MALLVGENARDSLQLAEWLEARGGYCQFAQSYRDACFLISSTKFDLVLSEYHLSDRSALPLLDLLEGSLATLFFCTRIEDGSIWLKMLERGKRCVGVPVLRSNELARALAEVLESGVEHPDQEAVSAG
jgi:hypothetical protein